MMDEALNLQPTLPFEGAYIKVDSFDLLQTKPAI